MEETSLKKLVDVHGLSLALAKTKADYEAEISRASQNIVQSNWEEDDLTSLSYIQNRPAIRAGEGENSIVEGKITDGAAGVDATMYTIYVTGDASANEYTYTTEDTLPSNMNLRVYGLAYNADRDRYVKILKCSDGILKVAPTLSQQALNNFQITIYRGHKSFAKGTRSHAEGWSWAGGNHAHAECGSTYAYGAYSHAEGYVNAAVGLYSHVEGYNNVAGGAGAHSEGIGSIASSVQGQHVQGKYNIVDSSDTYAHIVGNGTSDSARSNAHTLDWAGNGWYAGKLTVGSAPTADMDVTTKAYVDNLAATAEDDEEILNLLTEYGYYAPVADADGNVVTDADNNIILG